MRSRLLRKIGSIIGLLAVLMTTLAPTVSQALVANARVQAMLNVYCSASAGLQVQADNHPASHHGGIGHWDSCGYCNLAAHVPVLPLLHAASPPPLDPQTQPSRQAAQEFAPYAPEFAVQPRAPPAFS